MGDLDAGEFGRWLVEMRASLHGGPVTDVPCDGCTACCRSGQFIHVDPDETAARAHIPRQLLFPAPGLPAGHHLIGHDESGRCPMLGERGCTIYAHRPRACRMYDCRIFAAAGVTPDKPLIADRVAQWRFQYASERERRRHDAVRSAAVFLGMPGGLTAPASPTQRALAAVDGYDEFAAD